jgi:hypothetical protein
LRSQVGSEANEQRENRYVKDESSVPVPNLVAA